MPALASELAATLGTLAETSESLAVLKALRAASAGGAVTAALLDEVASALGGWSGTCEGTGRWD